MKDSIILYANKCVSLNDKFRQHYLGLSPTDIGLIVEFVDRSVLNLYGLKSYGLSQQYGEIHYDKHRLDKALVNPLELRYLSEKFRGQKGYEDYTRPTIEYLKSTDRLTNNDYNYFMNRLKWTYDVVVVEDSYGFFDFKEVPVEWSALPGQDSLVFVGREDEIVEIYSGFNRPDEYRYETIVDRKQLDISKIEEKYMTEFKRFVFG